MVCAVEHREKIRRMIRDHTAKLLAAGPEACHAYLVELGTHNPDGTLTKEYGGEYTTPRG